MGNPNKVNTQALSELEPTEIVSALAAMRPGVNPDFTAIEHIKDAETAGLYLQGAADRLVSAYPGYFNDGDRHKPLTAAKYNLAYVAGYFVTEPTEGLAQHDQIMEPWNQAYYRLTAA